MSRARTVLIYAVSIFVVFLRLQSVCEGDIAGCKERMPRAGVSNLPSWKYKLIRKIHSDLPSPHSELLLGMTIGIDDFQHLPLFSEMLRETGTVHVVVVSGYNVTLVLTFVLGLLGSLYKRQNMVLALAATLGYSLLSGFDPPVVRAWLMGAVLILGKYYGMNLNALLVLVFTGILLLIMNPFYFFSLSFLLSFMATLSLILFDSLLLVSSKSTLMQDLKSTLSVQILVWPVISYFFGTVSLISPIVNMLILWTVPLTTILGSFYVLAALLGFDFISAVLANLAYFPLDMFVRFVEVFAKVPYATVNFEMSAALLAIYYFILVVFLIKRRSA